MSSKGDGKQDGKRRENVFSNALINLYHIRWLQKNIDKYAIGKWAELREGLLEEITYDNYEVMEERYNSFIDHFSNNPYDFSCPMEEKEEKITTSYPECYFVEVRIEGREGEKIKYVSIGFLEELKTEISEEDLDKFTRFIEESVKEFLGKEKKMFWIHTYSKAEGVYLRNFYECYKDGWKTDGRQKTDRKRCGNGRDIPKMNILLMVVIFILILLIMADLCIMPEYRMRYRDNLLLLILAIAIVEISCISVSVFHKLKSGFYRRAIREYETDDLYRKCCNEVDLSVWSGENKRLHVMTAKDYLPGLEKKLRIKVGDGLIEGKGFAGIFLIGIFILTFLCFRIKN